MEANKNHSAVHGERVSSTYAEIYLHDDYCNFRKPLDVELENDEPFLDEIDDDEWVSPSDLLIGIIELKPPFTSKITRGKTHEGILAIGNDVLQKERAKFLKHLSSLVSDNDLGWAHILEDERKAVQQKVKRIYNKIFEAKSKIMSDEISQFYEKTLQELEDHLRAELKTVLLSAHANIISDLNVEIKQKLAAEKIILENELKKIYTTEVKKIKQYYKILFDNEVYRYNKLVNQALFERNDALTAFYKQIEAENITSTMYVMCTERKKCKVKKFILDSYQTLDISEKTQKLKERQKILDNYARKEVHISQMNREWEEKIKKVLLLFLKFISFGLKILPEQTTFLLDLEKLIVLQMNEMQKNPEKCPSILVEEELFQNIFKFEETESQPQVCKEEPFFIIGDLSDPIPPRYGSRETLPSDVDLPYVRVDRQFLYAKCHDYEQIKKVLESERCKCQDIPSQTISDFSIPSRKQTVPPSPPSPSLSPSVSSDEPLLIDDIERLHHCPARSCQNWAERNSFPYLDSYLDFTEEKFERVKTILGKPMSQTPPPDLIDPKKYVTAQLPFAATKEPYHNVETQYSSQEELYIPEVGCTCFDKEPLKPTVSRLGIKESPSKEMNMILQKRRRSLRNIIQKHPKLLKMFTDECFDFQL